MSDFFETGIVSIGGKDVAFERKPIQKDFTMYVPVSFSEDNNVVSNYTYLFSRDKSPLSIAIKYSPETKLLDREKMIASYFSNSPEVKLLHTQQLDDGILYRETVTSSEYMSIYSLRFSVEEKDGMLFGCFNCSAKYKDDWKPVVIEMLKNIKRS